MTNFKDFDWNVPLKKFCEFFELNVEKSTSTKDIAERTGLSPSSIGSIRTTLMYIGALKLRYGKNVIAKGYAGKGTYLTLTMSYKAIQDEMKRRKLVWGHELFELIAMESGRSANNPQSVAGRRMAKQRAKEVQVQVAPVTHATPATFTPREQEPVTMAEPVAISIEHPEARPEFQVLRPLLRDEPKALVEMARNYAGRKSFIDEKIEEFAAHGLTLTMDAIGMEKDDRLEQIALVLPYIDALERTHRHLTSQPKTAVISDEVRVLREKVNELQREKSRSAELAERALREAKDRYAAKEREQSRIIDTLQLEIGTLRKQQPGSAIVRPSVLGTQSGK